LYSLVRLSSASFFLSFLSACTSFSHSGSDAQFLIDSKEYILIHSALEGADVLCHYHPNEEQDAKNTVEYIKKVAPNAKVDIYAKDLRTEQACLEMVEEVKKWSGGKLDILCVIITSFFLCRALVPHKLIVPSRDD
jgi:hypothetical protein